MKPSDLNINIFIVQRPVFFIIICRRVCTALFTIFYSLVTVIQLASLLSYIIIAISLYPCHQVPLLMSYIFGLSQRQGTTNQHRDVRAAYATGIIKPDHTRSQRCDIYSHRKIVQVVGRAIVELQCATKSKKNQLHGNDSLQPSVPFKTIWREPMKFECCYYK